MKGKFKDEFPFEIVEVQGKPYMFTNMRICRESIPDGLFAYDVGDACDGEFWRIQPFVLVNHWGTIIGKDEMLLNSSGAYYCAPIPENDNVSSEGDFLGISVSTVAEYMKVAKEYNDKKEENYNG